jgi:hypothetical protein
MENVDPKLIKHNVEQDAPNLTDLNDDEEPILRLECAEQLELKRIRCR